MPRRHAVTTTPIPEQRYVIVSLGIELHALDRDHTLALLRGDDHPDRTVGLDFDRDGLEQPAALIFTTDADDAASDADRARALATDVGLTPTGVEILTVDEYEARALTGTEDLA
jgi:hypothetical protein